MKTLALSFIGAVFADNLRILERQTVGYNRTFICDELLRAEFSVHGQDTPQISATFPDINAAAYFEFEPLSGNPSKPYLVQQGSAISKLARTCRSGFKVNLSLKHPLRLSHTAIGEAHVVQSRLKRNLDSPGGFGINTSQCEAVVLGNSYNDLILAQDIGDGSLSCRFTCEGCDIKPRRFLQNGEMDIEFSNFTVDQPNVILRCHQTGTSPGFIAATPKEPNVALDYYVNSDGWYAGGWDRQQFEGEETLLTAYVLYDDLSVMALEGALRGALSRIGRGENCGHVCSKEHRAQLHPTHVAEYCEYNSVEADFMLLPLLGKYVTDYPQRATELLKEKSSHLESQPNYLGLLLENHLNYIKELTEPYVSNPVRENLLEKTFDKSLGVLLKASFAVSGGLIPAALQGMAATAKFLGQSDVLSFANDAYAVWKDAHGWYCMNNEGCHQISKNMPKACAGCESFVYAEDKCRKLFHSAGLNSAGDKINVFTAQQSWVLAYRDDLPDLVVTDLAETVSARFPYGLYTEAGPVAANLVHLTPWVQPVDPAQVQLVRRDYLGVYKRALQKWRNIYVSRGAQSSAAYKAVEHALSQLDTVVDNFEGNYWSYSLSNGVYQPTAISGVPTSNQPSELASLI